MKIPKKEHKIQRKFLFLRDPFNKEQQILTIPSRIFVIGSQCINKNPLRVQISLTEIFSKWFSLRAMKKYDKSALMQISQVFATL